MSTPVEQPRGRRQRASDARARVRDAHHSGRLREWWYDLLDVGRQPRLVRSALRYVVTWGNLGAGGVTFTAMLSLTAALTIVVNTARAFLGDRPELVAEVIAVVNSVIPGVIDDGGNDGLIPAAYLIRDGTWGWTTAISTVVILWTAITMMTGLRRAVRQMFGLGGAPIRFVRGKLIDLWGFILLALTFFSSSGAVSAMTLLGENVMGWLGLRSSVGGWLLAAGALLLVAALDAFLVWLIVRVISKVRVPWTDMRQGMLLGALGFGLLRLGGTSLVGAISAGPLFSTFAAVATLLLTLNLALRWLLFVAAWTANPPAAHVPVHPDTVHAKDVPNYVTVSAPHTLAWPHHQVTGSLIPDQHPRFERQGRGRRGQEQYGGRMILSPRVHDDGRSRLVAYDHGAHLASWEVEGVPVLWLSPKAVLDGSSAIRGGVPICFPWFADGPDGAHSPSHGVVRAAPWTPTTTRDGEIWAWELTHTDVADAPGAHQIPGPFHLRYAVRLSPGARDGFPVLDLRLEVHNPGSTSYTVEVALHTYLAVGDVEQVRIEGLDGAGYHDKVTGTEEDQRGALELTGETDRVYDRNGPVQVHDPVRARVLEVTPHGSTQTVVWNPWAEKSAAAVDLGSDAWRGFVCVESAASGKSALTMAPGQTRILECSLTARPVRPV